MAVSDRVAQQYRHALRDLTFNSKPIINNLTMLAHENMAQAPAIVKVLTTHLTTTDPSSKLPALYLIDSICKNVGQPFIELFSADILTVFSRSFQQLKSPKLEHEFVRVMKTWNGLFSEQVVKELERKHNGSRKRSAPSNDDCLRPALVVALTDLRAAVSQPAHLYRGDLVASIFAHLAASDIDQELLRDLDSKARIPDKRPLIEMLNRVLQPHEKPSAAVIPSPSSIPFIDPKTLAALSPALSIISSTISSTSSTKTTASCISATNEDVSIARPYLFRVIYQDLPLQCKTCGLRFPDTIDGRSKMNTHLDQHFKRNMRLKELSKKIMTRDWFARESEWIMGTEKEVTEKEVQTVFSNAAQEETEKVEESKISAGTDRSGNTCCVCDEAVEVVWDDDADNWMYRNAILINGQLIDVHRHRPETSQVVLFNQTDQQVIVHNLGPSESKDLTNYLEEEERICSKCHRPFDDYESTNKSVVDKNYFKLLGNWLNQYHKIRNLSSYSFGSDVEDTVKGQWCSKNLPDTAFNQGYYSKFFKGGRRLGHGARGSVFLCQHLIDGVPLGEYAIKVIPIGDERSWLLGQLKEVHILERLKHPNIIEYKHTWIEYYRMSKFAPSVPCLFILMEYANGGNLDDFIQLEVFEPEQSKQKRKKVAKIPTYLEETTILKIFLQIAKGLFHLHSLGIVHRDLKPANLLLNYPRDSADIPNVLISDFGECSDTDEPRETSRTGATGTIEFMAPELFQTSDDGKYLHDHSMSSDIWSLGMILYYMYFCKLPYLNVENYDDLRDEILDLSDVQIHCSIRPISKPMHDILHLMLSINRTRRPALRDVIKVVETVLMIKSSPLMDPFATPSIQALPSSSPNDMAPIIQRHGDLIYKERKHYIKALVDYSGWVMLLYLFSRCYPRMPNVGGLTMTMAKVVEFRFDARIGIKLTLLIAIASLIVMSFNKSCCA